MIFFHKANNMGADQSAQLRRLVFAIPRRQVFLRQSPSMTVKSSLPVLVYPRSHNGQGRLDRVPNYLQLK